MKDKTIELKNLKLLYILMAVLVITDYVMPQYFGIHIGFDITCTRAMNVLIVIYFFLNKEAGNHFLYMISKCKLTYFLLPFLMVVLYTGVLRGSINTLFLAPLEILTLFMLIYGIRYVIGLEKFFDWTIKVAYFLGIMGLIEYFVGFSIFHRLLATVPNVVQEVYRSGQYRIMGPCGHPLGYGLLLLLLLVFACVDYKNDKIYLFKRPALLVLIMINVFLTGSRSTLAIMVVELICLLIFSEREEFKKSLVYIVISLVIFFIILAALSKTNLGNYIMMQIAMMVDELFDTEYAALFGADVTTLKNSSGYREVLLKIFELDWLNPMLGRGVKSIGGAEINGVYIHSIDSFYVATYIRYGYPGLIAYVLFIVCTAIHMLYTSFKYKSGICKALTIGFICYFINLWYLDTLQTLKYLYLLLAGYYVFYMKSRNTY